MHRISCLICTGMTECTVAMQLVVQWVPNINPNMIKDSPIMPWFRHPSLPLNIRVEGNEACRCGSTLGRAQIQKISISAPLRQIIVAARTRVRSSFTDPLIHRLFDINRTGFADFVVYTIWFLFLCRA